MTSARFRADPRKVRVSIRREEDTWCVTIATRDGSASVQAKSKTPTHAILFALKKAEKMAGVDVDMQWAYGHPQHPGDAA